MNLKKYQKALAFVLSAAIVFTSAVMSPKGLKAAAGDSSGGLSVTLGAPTLSGSDYLYQSAAVTGSNILTIMINFSDSVKSGDTIVLPNMTGFNVSSTTSGNNYTKRININKSTVSGGANDAGAVQSYLQQVKYTLDSGHKSQSIKVILSTDDIETDTFYNIDTQHYYQFISDPAKNTWIKEYASAQSDTYMGRHGYLATVTSLAEDTFLNTLSGGKTGWLGGTILANSGSRVDGVNNAASGGLYYSSFSTTSFVSNGWYWACGPEIGKIFYDVTSTGTSTISTLDTRNVNEGYYFNWGRGAEPNNTNGGENCLTTLNVSVYGYQGTLFSWNDISFNRNDTSDYMPAGYFVEYGDKLVGSDETPNPAEYVSTGGMISSANYTVTVNVTKDGGACDAPDSVTLRNDDISYSMTETGTGVYADTAVPPGTYDVYVGGQDTGTSVTVSSGNVTVALQYLSGGLTITGTVAVGGTLTANYSSGNNTGVLSYQWTRNGSDIGGATGASYILSSDDTGAAIAVKITSSTQLGSLTSTPVRLPGIVVLNKPQTTDTTNMEYTFGNATVDDNDSITSITFTGTNSTTVASVPASPAPSSSLSSIDGTTRVYTYVFAGGITSAQAQSFIRGIMFNYAAGAEISVTVDANKTVLPTGAKITTFAHPDGSNHYYMFVPADLISWTDAYNAAKGYTYMGMKGYLATITSEDEDNILRNISTISAWSAGTRYLNADSSQLNDPGSISALSVAASYYYWACGPEAKAVYYNSTAPSSANGPGNTGYKGAYNNWGTLQPDANTTGEVCMQVNWPYDTNASGQMRWNDLPNIGIKNLGLVDGYFVEFSSYPTGMDSTYASDRTVINLYDLSDGITQNAAVTLAAPSSLAYDGTSKAYTPAADGLTLSAGDYTLTYTSRNGTVYSSSTTPPKNTGDYTVTFALTAAGQAKYNVTGTLTANFTITPAPLAVTPVAGQSKPYGTADPASLSYTYSGNASGETPEFSGALSRAPGAVLGDYEITQGGLKLANGTDGKFLAGNYTLDFSSTPVYFAVQSFTPADSATLSIPNGDNGWFKDVSEGITLTAPTGYSISTTGTLTTNDWASSITVDSTDGSVKTANYYLRRNSDDAISTTLVSGGYKVDTVAPSNITVSYGTNELFKLLNTVTFGLFFNDTVTVTLTATDTGSGVKGFKYTLDGAEQTVSATGGSAEFNINPQYKGNVSGIKAVDNAGNVSGETSTENFAVDSATPDAPTVNTNGYTSGTWTKDNVTLTVSGSTAESGIAKYQYSTDNGTTWQEIATTQKTDATDTEPYNAVKAELTICADCSGVSYKFRAVSNAGNDGSASVATVVNINSVSPVISSVGGNPSDWTNSDVTLTVTAADSTGGLAAAAYSFNDGATWQADASKTFSSNQTVNVVVKDKAGNISAATTVDITKIDKTAPVISSVDGNPSSWTKDDATLSVTADDPASGLAAAAYSFNGGQTWQSSASKAYSSDQTIATGKIEVKDNAGNVASFGSDISITKIDKSVPSGMTVKIHDNAFTTFLDTITFGLFFNNTVDVALSASDTPSGIDYYEYQLVNANAGESYNPSGSWTRSDDGAFSVSQQFKGAVYAYAVDMAGNQSDIVSSDGFIADSQAPSVPTVAATVSGNPYDGDWTSGNVQLVASGSTALSGIDHYEYKIGDSGTWQAMTGGTLTTSTDMNGDIHFRAVSSSCVDGNERIVTVKRDAVTPAVHVDVTGTTGTWTKGPIAFTLSDTVNNLSPVSYQVKIGSGDWTAVSGDTVTVTGNTNKTYQFRAVSGSGLTSTASTVYNVKLDSAPIAEVEREIDNLPDPATATDQQIMASEQQIKDAKTLYDSLGVDEKNEVGQARQDKLNQLIYRLNALLVIVPKDQGTGITAGNLGTSVLVPELNDPNVSKVVVQLVVDPVSKNNAQHANFAIATTTLDSSGKSLVAAYDVSLFKTVFDASGSQISSGKVSNSAIDGPVTIRIPVPAEYLDVQGLQVAYIDDAGTVTMLPTTTVTVDGVRYLQFTTTHFSVYAVIAPHAGSNPKTGDTSGNNPLGYLWPLGISCIAVSGGLFYRKKRRIARQK
ncbi:MAG: MBG domain-containing protein [Clostridia bacterium]|nr:MBG domain-containing protein [Clostridia bacterium]